MFKGIFFRCYCRRKERSPLVWMLHDRSINSKVNKIHERALKIVCRDSGNNIINNVNCSVATNKRNLKLPMIEI